MKKNMTGRTSIFINVVAAIVLAAMALCASQSCGKRHSDENGSVSVELRFSDERDRDEAAIKNVRLWIFDEAGSLAGRFEYRGAADLALQRFHLDEGRYTFVTAVNLVDPFVCGEPDGSGDLTGLIFRLKSPDASPEHALYGVTEETVEGGTSKIVVSRIRRVLSELTVRMSGVPSGVNVKAVVRYVAQGVIPALKDDDGSFGLPTKEENRNLALPEGRTTDGTLVTPTMRLMPTPGGSSSTLLRLTVILPDGNTLESDIVAPPMRPSGRYILMIDYATLQPGMIVNPYRINDWTEGWVVNGEVLDPDE